MSSSVVGSAPVAALAPKSTCSELEVDHPANDAATCWWLSVNFALFHKKRPELDAYFSDTTNVSSTGTVDKVKDKLTKTLKDNFSTVYNHYTGTTSVTKDKLLGLRTANGMAEAFNVKSKIADKDKVEFDVAGTTYQAADEYISQLFKYIPFGGKVGDLPIKDNNNGHTYDLYMHRSYYGIETPTEVVVESTGKKSYTHFYQLNSTSTHTVIFHFIRKSDTKSFIDDPIDILKQITIPLIDPTKRTVIEKEKWVNDIKEQNKNLPNSDLEALLLKQDYNDLATIPIKDQNVLRNHADFATFTLDAIVEATGGHFNAYVKCSNSDNWIFYGAMVSGKSIETLTFKEMIARDVIKRATLLFYTRVGTAAAPSTSVAIPEPLPGPPGSAALPAGLPAPPSSALAVPASLPAPPALAAAADVPAPLPEHPALAAPAAADAAVPAAANAAVPAPLPEPPALAVPAAANAAVPALLPEPPAPLPEPLVPPPPAAPPSAAPPPSLAAAAPMPPARS